MAKTRTQLVSTIRRYAAELERLGLPVERIILFGSHLSGQAHATSDVDLAVFSEAFGGPDHLEFSGLLSEAKWNTEPMIEAMGFNPCVLEDIPPVSFLHEIARTGQVVYRRGLHKSDPSRRHRPIKSRASSV